MRTWPTPYSLDPQLQPARAVDCFWVFYCVPLSSFCRGILHFIKHLYFQEELQETWKIIQITALISSATDKWFQLSHSLVNYAISWNVWIIRMILPWEWSLYMHAFFIVVEAQVIRVYSLIPWPQTNPSTDHSILHILLQYTHWMRSVSIAVVFYTDYNRQVSL